MVRLTTCDSLGYHTGLTRRMISVSKLILHRDKWFGICCSYKESGRSSFIQSAFIDRSIENINKKYEYQWLHNWYLSKKEFELLFAGVRSFKNQRRTRKNADVFVSLLNITSIPPKLSKFLQKKVSDPQISITES